MAVGARQRLALGQAALLSALVAGTPVPRGSTGNDWVCRRGRSRPSGRSIVAKVAVELPEILGDAYRQAFLAYAQRHPMSGGYRRDASTRRVHAARGAPRGRGDAAAACVVAGAVRPTPPSQRPTARLARATRRVVLRR